MENFYWLLLDQGPWDPVQCCQSAACNTQVEDKTLWVTSGNLMGDLFIHLIFGFLTDLNTYM